MVCGDCFADVARFFECDAQAKVRIAVAWVSVHGPLQSLDGVLGPAGLKAGEAKIMLDYGIRRLENCRIAQRRDRIARPASLQKLPGQREKPLQLRRRRWVWRRGHSAIPNEMAVRIVSRWLLEL